MLEKFLIVGSKSDPASRRIILSLMDMGRFNFHLIEGEMLSERNLDKEKIKEFDFVIFVSKHKSEKKEKTLSVHAPGNWGEVWGGGEEGRVSPASSSFQKHLFKTLYKVAEESDLIPRYSVTMEVTHHGPLIDRPSVFIEVGGSEFEWKDRRATFAIAKTVREALETWKKNPYEEHAIGIGGGHYCPAFNQIQLTSNVALAHVIPKYVGPITEQMVLEAVNNTIEEIDFAIIDWKGIGKAKERDEVIEILEKNYIRWKKSGEIKK
jgi:D-aminoacyl-tRNA deacylase